MLAGEYVQLILRLKDVGLNEINKAIARHQRSWLYASCPVMVNGVKMFVRSEIDLDHCFENLDGWLVP